MGVTKQLPGSHLLAALHAGMERMKTCVKVARAASKKPQNRSNMDINYIVNETQNVHLLAQHGAGVHRDLCHVLQACSLSQMSSLRLPGEHPGGLFVYVMQGRLQARTRNKAAFESNSSSSTGSSPGSKPAGSKAGDGAAGNSSSGAAGPSEADLRALFDSIDIDGSGAIDVEELQYALEVMGIKKSAEEVQELMDSVDKDGSGELEFGEFVLILTKMGVGRGQQQATWQELPDGSWALEVGEGGCLGQAALEEGLSQDGLLLALEDASLLLLDANIYTSILTTGFDGQLNAKVAFLKTSPALVASLSNRTDLRGLAYVAAAEVYSWGALLYAAGQSCQPGALLVIQEGSCRIVAKIKATAKPLAGAVAAAAAAGGSSSGQQTPRVAAADGPPAESSAAAAAAALLASPRQGLKTLRNRLVERQVELAVVGPGDVLGEAALLGSTSHNSAAVVCSSKLSLLRLPVADLQQLVHPADLQRLLEVLRQRDAERTARLSAATAMNSTLQAQQQHIKDIAVASATAVVATAANADIAAGDASVARTLNQQSSTSPCLSKMLSRKVAFSSAAGGLSDGQNEQVCSSSDGVGAKGVCSSSAVTTTGGAVAANDDDAAMQMLLPSSGAAAAAAIAAAGGRKLRRDLPSRASRAEVHAVSHLLQRLVGFHEDMQAAQGATIAATAAALAAATGSIPATATGASPIPPMSVPQAAGTNPAAPIESTAAGASGDVLLPGLLPTSGTAPAAEAKELASCRSSAARTGLCSLSPGALKHSSAPGLIGDAGTSGLQQEPQRMSALDVLLPDRLIAKLNAALTASQPGSNAASPRGGASALHGRINAPQRLSTAPAHATNRNLFGATSTSCDGSSSGSRLSPSGSQACARHTTSQCGSGGPSNLPGRRLQSVPGGCSKAASAPGQQQQPHYWARLKHTSSTYKKAAAFGRTVADGASSSGSGEKCTAAAACCYSTAGSRTASKDNLHQRHSSMPGSPLNPWTQCPAARSSCGVACCYTARQGMGGIAVGELQQGLTASVAPVSPCGASCVCGQAADEGSSIQQQQQQGLQLPQATQERVGGMHELIPETPQHQQSLAQQQQRGGDLRTDDQLMVITLAAEPTLQLDRAPWPNSDVPSLSPAPYDVLQATPRAIAAVQAQLADCYVHLPSPRSCEDKASGNSPRNSTAITMASLLAKPAVKAQRSPMRVIAAGRPRAQTAAAAAAGGMGHGSLAGLSAPLMPGCGSARSSSAVFAGFSCQAPNGCSNKDDDRVCSMDWSNASSTGAGGPETAVAASQDTSTAALFADAGLHWKEAASVVRPVPGGFFIEVDGPVWQAAELAADSASWVLSSRTSRQQRHTASAMGGTACGSQRLSTAGAAAVLPLAPTAAEACSNADARVSLGGCDPGAAVAIAFQQSKTEDSSNKECNTVAAASKPAVAFASLPVAAPGAVCMDQPCSQPSPGAKDHARPAIVPKLQLHKLQVTLKGGCSSPTGSGRTASKHTAIGSAPSTSTPQQGGQGGSSICIALSEPGGQAGQQQQQSPASVPHTLPAFSPRRSWTPGGPLSARSVTDAKPSSLSLC